MQFRLPLFKPIQFEPENAWYPLKGTAVGQVVPRSVAHFFDRDVSVEIS